MADVLHFLQIQLGNSQKETAFPLHIPYFGNSIRTEKMLHYLSCYCWDDANQQPRLYQDRK